MSKNPEISKKPNYEKKTLGLRLKRLARYASADFRQLPDFIIIGAQKAGTSSLFHNLGDHPNVLLPIQKEIHYYALNEDKGLRWYKHFFPTRFEKRNRETEAGKVAVGEASPFYLYHPHVPIKLSKLLPDLKLVAILRDPVERAFSHYWHKVNKKKETLSFEEAIQTEEARLESEKEAWLNDPDFKSFNHHHFSYRDRGLYLNQLLRWEKSFPKEQMFVISSEELFSNMQESLDNLSEFLEIPKHDFPSIQRYNVGSYEQKIPEKARKKLAEYFKPHNQKLYDYLGRDFGWQ